MVIERMRFYPLRLPNEVETRLAEVSSIQWSRSDSAVVRRCIKHTMSVSMDELGRLLSTKQAHDIHNNVRRSFMMLFNGPAVRLLKSDMRALGMPT